MSMAKKLEFIKTVTNSPAYKKVPHIVLHNTTDELLHLWFMSKRQSQGLRLTKDGFEAALQAELSRFLFKYTSTQYLQFLLDISKHMPVPFFLLQNEICIFDEKISTAIVLAGGIINFIAARKFNAV